MNEAIRFLYPFVYWFLVVAGGIIGGIGGMMVAADVSRVLMEGLLK